MADYDKDIAEERIQIRNDKNKIFEDDKEKRETEGASNKMLASNSPAKNQNKGYADSRELTDMPLTKDMTGGRGTSWMSKHATQRFSAPTKMVSPLKEYDRVVEGGNKGDDSKTKPGEKDYTDKK